MRRRCNLKEHLLSDAPLLRAQVRFWEDEDPELYALLLPMDKGARNRTLRQLVRAGLQVSQGRFIPTAANALGESDTVELKVSPEKAKPAIAENTFVQRDFSAAIPVAPGTFYTPQLRSANE